MKYLLEEWALKGGTLTQFEDALLHLGKKEVIPGMLYMIVSTLAMIYQLIKALFLLSSFISDLHALQKKESIVIDTSEQISIKPNNKSSNLHTIHYSYI